MTRKNHFIMNNTYINTTMILGRKFSAMISAKPRYVRLQSVVGVGHYVAPCSSQYIPFSNKINSIANDVLRYNLTILNENKEFLNLLFGGCLMFTIQMQLEQNDTKCEEIKSENTAATVNLSLESSQGFKLSSKTEEDSYDEEEERSCPFCKFFLDSPCKDSFIQWQKCIKKSEQATHCMEPFYPLKECMTINNITFDTDDDVDTDDVSE